MSIETITSADGKFRARIESDDYAENPRDFGEPLSGALTVPDSRYYATPARGPLADQWDRLMDTYGPSRWTGNRDATDRGIAIMERYVRLCGGVATTLTPHDGPTTLFYVTPELMASAGFTPEESDHGRMSELLEGEVNEYRAWGEGEVYIIVVEELANWQRTDDGRDGETMETWETVDSIGGIIGYGYAEQELKRMLADALDLTVKPAAFARGNAVTTRIGCPGCGQPITVSDHGKTECGGEGEGGCSVSIGDDTSDVMRVIAAQQAHERAAELAAPFQD